MILAMARLIEAAGYLFGASVRCVVFTALDGLEWCAKWTR